ncbi:MAG: hypothetical protein AB1500_07660 [Bacillota bacterium]
MLGYKFELKNVELAKLSEEDLPNVARFDCGEDEINHFLKDEALEEQDGGLNVTVLLYYGERNHRWNMFRNFIYKKHIAKLKLIGFYSICADAILLTEEERDDIPYAVAPALKIARLGVDKSEQGRWFGVFMIEYVKREAKRLRNELGIRFVTLDAYLNNVEYYKRFGFVINERNKRKNIISMRARF